VYICARVSAMCVCVCVYVCVYVCVCETQAKNRLYVLHKLSFFTSYPALLFIFFSSIFFSSLIFFAFLYFSFSPFRYFLSIVFSSFLFFFLFLSFIHSFYLILNKAMDLTSLSAYKLNKSFVCL